MKPVSQVPDPLAVSFDDEGWVANAGPVVVATFSARLAIGRLDESVVNIAVRQRSLHRGKVLT